MKPLLLLLAATVFAQTVVKLDQIRAAPVSAVQLLAVGLDGKLLYLNLGQGFKIMGNTISIEDPVVASTPLNRDEAGNYYPTTSAAITRNGVMQQRGIDYSVTSTSIVPVLKWEADDVVAMLKTERP